MALAALRLAALRGRACRASDRGHGRAWPPARRTASRDALVRVVAADPRDLAAPSDLSSAVPCRAIPWPAPGCPWPDQHRYFRRCAAREPLHSIPAERSLLLGCGCCGCCGAPHPRPAPRVQGVWVSKQGLVLGPLARTASGVNSRRVRRGGAALQLPKLSLVTDSSPCNVVARGAVPLLAAPVNGPQATLTACLGAPDVRSDFLPRALAACRGRVAWRHMAPGSGAPSAAFFKRFIRPRRVG